MHETDVLKCLIDLLGIPVLDSLLLPWVYRPFDRFCATDRTTGAGNGSHHTHHSVDLGGIYPDVAVICLVAVLCLEEACYEVEDLCFSHLIVVFHSGFELLVPKRRIGISDVCGPVSDTSGVDKGGFAWYGCCNRCRLA